MPGGMKLASAVAITAYELRHRRAWRRSPRLSRDALQNTEGERHHRSSGRMSYADSTAVAELVAPPRARAARSFAGVVVAAGSCVAWPSVEATDQRVQPYGGPGPAERHRPEPSADLSRIEVTDAGTDDQPTEKHPAAAPASGGAHRHRYCR